MIDNHIFGDKIQTHLDKAQTQSEKSLSYLHEYLRRIQGHTIATFD